ncbi:MAG: trp operon repressor [Verrucomicrobiota bacterium]|nr:trp operon repressor [Verrucomicrobiota bacterium]
MKEEDGWRQFLKLCEEIKTKERFKEFFDLFLTLEEKDDLGKRFQVIKALLKEEAPQREIAEALNVSIFKITRGSNALKIIKPRLREFLKEHMT